MIVLTDGECHDDCGIPEYIRFESIDMDSTRSDDVRGEGDE